MASWLIAQLCKVSPAQRRLWAARLALWTLAEWAVSHVLLIVLPSWFFEHVLNALSQFALVLTCVVLVVTTDVRVEVEDGSGDG